MSTLIAEEFSKGNWRKNIQLERSKEQQILRKNIEQLKEEWLNILKTKKLLKFISQNAVFEVSLFELAYPIAINCNKPCNSEEKRQFLWLVIAKEIT